MSEESKKDSKGIGVWAPAVAAGIMVTLLHPVLTSLNNTPSELLFVGGIFGFTFLVFHKIFGVKQFKS
ncbi:MAG: hypothetical protein ACOCQD_03330 [archaeon]